MDALAERLGIGPRHLRRLFLQHLGASPVTVAQTRRLHFAKKLSMKAACPCIAVAMASGFGSIRRFNASFQKTYGRSPGQLRQLGKKAATLPSHQYRFQLRFRTPFCWDSLLQFLAPRSIPGVEIVEAGAYRRTFSLHGHAGWMDATLNPFAGSINLLVQYPESRYLFLIVERARCMFDLSADPSELAQLSHDPLLGGRIAARPGLRVPGCWDGFELAVRAILGQQVTVRGASTLAGRLVREFGSPVAAMPRGLTHLFPLPEKLANANLSRMGLPHARARTISCLARAVLDGKISFSGVVDVENFLTRLCELPGIGSWTAQYIAMRALREPDAFPSGDLGLLRAAGLRSPRELESRAEVWQPWRAYAAMYLWQTPRRVSTQVPNKKGVTRHAHLLHENREPSRTVAAGR